MSGTGLARERAGPGLDIRVPNAARIYGYLLAGRIISRPTGWRPRDYVEICAFPEK
jgi:hypothetical protein